MYHSITIGEKNTYDDWHLISASRPVTNPPKPKTNYLDIPGGDGSIDLTEANNAGLVYANREGTWEFIVENDHEDWDVIYTKVLNYVHGRYFDYIKPEDETYYFFKGRITVDEWRSEPQNSRLTLSYNLDPYKYELHSDDADWPWDPFDFEHGEIVDPSIDVDGTYVYLLNVAQMPVTPVFYTSYGGMQIGYKGESYDLLPNRDNKFYDLTFRKGEHTLFLMGHGRLTIKYRNGVL